MLPATFAAKDNGSARDGFLSVPACSGTFYGLRECRSNKDQSSPQGKFVMLTGRPAGSKRTNELIT
jgi:hypothetical protein